MSGGWQNKHIARTLKALYLHYENLGVKMGKADEEISGMPRWSEWKFTDDPQLPEGSVLEKFYDGGTSVEEFMKGMGGELRGEEVFEPKVAEKVVVGKVAVPGKGMRPSWHDETENAVINELDAIMGSLGVSDPVDVKMTKSEINVPTAAVVPKTDLKTQPHPVIQKEHDARHAALLTHVKTVKPLKKGGKKTASTIAISGVVPASEHFKKVDALEKAEMAPGTFTATMTESGKVVTENIHKSDG